MRRIMILGCVAVAACVGGFSDRIIAGDVPPNFSAKYQPALENFKRCYSHVTIEGRLRREYPQTNRLLEQQYALRASGKLMRLDVTTTAQHDMGVDVGSVTSYIATTYGSLMTSRGPRSQGFDSATELSYSDVKSRIENTCPLMSPYKAVGQGTLVDLLRQPDVQVAGVQKVLQRGESLIKLSYNEGGGRGHASHRSWFLLSPAEGWAVREYFRTSGDGESQVVQRGTLAYDGMQDGAPLVKRIETWREEGPKRKCTLHELIEVSSFSTEDPSNDYFTAFDF
jgi:hypothetical protein